MLTPYLISKLQARFFQYQLNGDPIAAGTTSILEKQIQSGFHFWAESLTILYTTLWFVDSVLTDTGVNPFTSQFKSGSNQIGLSNDPIDLALIAAPGRMESAAASGDPTNPLHITGFPWPYLYEAAGSIMADTKNNSNADNTVKFLWTGFLIPVSVCRSADDFYSVLAQQYPQFGN